MTFQVNGIYRSIQGEGFWTGLPCTILRTQGCDLNCPYCDTKYTWDLKGGIKFTADQLRRELAATHPLGQMILITGGEPAMQDIEWLAEALEDLGPLHLETSGAYPFKGNFDWVTVSPKTNHPIPESVLAQTDEIKWLVGSSKDVVALCLWLQRTGWRGNISVQPISQNLEATNIAYDACLEHGWRLSIQIHKYIERR